MHHVNNKLHTYHHHSVAKYSFKIPLWYGYQHGVFKSNGHCQCEAEKQPQAFTFTCVNTVGIVTDVCHYKIKHPLLVIQTQATTRDSLSQV